MYKEVLGGFDLGGCWVKLDDSAEPEGEADEEDEDEEAGGYWEGFDFLDGMG